MGLLSQVTANVKEILVTAQDEARAIGHGYIGTEHLLVALLSSPETPAVEEAVRQGATPDGARRHATLAFEATDNVARFVSDEEALAAVGVDLGEVRRRAEVAFGAGAVPMRVGAPPFTARVKLALDNAIAVAAADNRELVDLDDLLLGMLADRDSVASKALSTMCADLTAVVSAR